MIKTRCYGVVDIDDAINFMFEVSKSIGCASDAIAKVFIDSSKDMVPHAIDLCDGVRLHCNSWTGKRFTYLITSDNDDVNLRELSYDGMVHK